MEAILPAILAAYIANIASDGTGALARRRSLEEPREKLLEALTVQAQLDEFRVSEQSMVEVTNFMRSPEFVPLARMAVAVSISLHGSNLRGQFECQVEGALEFCTEISPPHRSYIASILAGALLSAASTRAVRAQQHRSPEYSMAQYLAGEPSFRPGDVITPAFDPARAAIFCDEYLAALDLDVSELVITHLDDQRLVEFDSIYVPPTFDVEAVRGDQRVLDLFLSNPHVVVKGKPGAGKSTLLRHLIRQVRSVPQPRPTIPIYIELRHYFAQSKEQAHTFIDYAEAEIARLYQLEVPAGVIDCMLRQGRCLVLFDGLDEVLDSRSRRDVTTAVRSFTTTYPLSPSVVTSRVVGYNEAPLPRELFLHADILDFSEAQVRQYATNWFRHDRRARDSLDTRAEGFLSESQVYASELRVNPLMLSLLCATYLGAGSMPKTRTELYEKCAVLLFDKWDGLRHVREPGAYKGSARAAVLAAALWMYESEERQAGVAESELVRFLSRQFESRSLDSIEARQDARDLVSLWRGRAWIITDIASTSDNEPIYRFSHQTFLEYFSAVQLVRTCRKASDLARALAPHIIASEWTVVSELALSLFNQSVEGGADEVISLLLSTSVHRREHMILLLFIVRGHQDWEVSAESALLIIKKSLHLYLEATALPDSPALYFAALERARAYDGGCDWSDFASGALVELSDGADRDSVAPYETELVLFLAFASLRNRPKVQQNAWRHLLRIARQASRRGVDAYVAAALLSRALIQEPQLAVRDASILTVPPASEFPPHGDSWRVVAAEFSVGLASAAELARSVPWQIALAGGAPLYSVLFESSHDLPSKSIVEDDQAVRAIGTDVLLQFSVGTWCRIPREQAKDSAETFCSVIVPTRMEGDRSAWESASKAMQSSSHAVSAGLVTVVAILAEAGHLLAYRESIENIERRLDLGPYEWVEKVVSAWYGRASISDFAHAATGEAGRLAAAWAAHSISFFDDPAGPVFL